MASPRDRFYQLFQKGAEMGAKGASQNEKKGLSLRDKIAMERLGLARRGEARRQKEDRERKVSDISKRYEKREIPTLSTALGGIEKNTQKVGKDGKPIAGGLLTNPDYQPKSTGPVASALPAWGVNIGESLGLLDEGAGSERQSLQRLINLDLRRMTGTAQTTAESGRQMIEKGLSVGGDPSQIKQGMKMMMDAIRADEQNIAAGYDPAVVEEYHKRGGTGVDDIIDQLRSEIPKTPAEDPAAAARKRMEELKRKAGIR